MPEDVPKETETIAAKRSLRVAEKLKKARLRMRKVDSWWNSNFVEILLVVGVFSLNLFLVYTYFGTPTSANTFYSGPVIPFLSQLFVWGGMSMLYGLQLSNLIFILFFPVSFYFLVKAVTERKSIAFLAILISSLPFYPFASVRIYSSLMGIDGAHIASLTISMVALLALFKFIKFSGVTRLIAASVLAAMVTLASPFGFSTFLIMAFILTFSEMLLGFGRLKLARFVAVLIFSSLLIAFWYNPHFSFWLLTGSLGEEVRRTIARLIPISLFALPALGAFGYLLFDRKPSLQPVFLASFFTAAFLLISAIGAGIFPSHPSRYVAELGISLSLLVSVVLVKISESIRFFEAKKTYLRFAIVLIYVGLSITIILSSGNAAFNGNVLGIWTGVEKGTVWQEREKFGGISSIFGYLVTLLGVSSLTYLYIQEKKLKKPESYVK